MTLFGRPSRRHETTGTRRRTQGRSWFGRKDPDRVAGGYKAALANPNTSRSGRKHAQRELESMGRGREAHVPLMTKIKRMFGMRSTPRSERHRSSRHTLGRRDY
ncbi:hypothetical protein BD309DRAFT_974852 [Dichomitus squalens]|uniref:Uncharacterized protein n=1 Tax=Dichomitus squalens TaxID=114155 RepID=A0A4V2K1A4_9APHY|nr:hypothetical protein BD311DRAFT_862854 [Dichomitus squalens]TBU37007.1 hypothetical protein BD309DRAFT_974852 [Dichomitus squalens]TBU64184.1 hypothetical protein BD310DRAFT_915515 [Dichomitus squalens]